MKMIRTFIQIAPLASQPYFWRGADLTDEETLRRAVSIGCEERRRGKKTPTQMAQRRQQMA
jgi:hypothetical protein